MHHLQWGDFSLSLELDLLLRFSEKKRSTHRLSMHNKFLLSSSSFPLLLYVLSRTHTHTYVHQSVAHPFSSSVSLSLSLSLRSSLFLFLSSPVRLMIFDYDETTLSKPATCLLCCSNISALVFALFIARLNLEVVQLARSLPLSLVPILYTGLCFSLFFASFLRLAIK